MVRKVWGDTQRMSLSASAKNCYCPGKMRDRPFWDKTLQATSAWANFTCNESKHAVRQNNGKSITYCWFLFFTTKFPDELGLGLCEKMGWDGLGLWEKTGSDGLGLWENIGRVFAPSVDWLGLDTGCDCWLAWLLPKDIWGKVNSWGNGLGNHYHVENNCGMCNRSMHGSNG